MVRSLILVRALAGMILPRERPLYYVLTDILVIALGWQVEGN